MSLSTRTAQVRFETSSQELVALYSIPDRTSRAGDLDAGLMMKPFRTSLHLPSVVG